MFSQTEGGMWYRYGIDLQDSKHSDFCIIHILYTNRKQHRAACSTQGSQRGHITIYNAAHYDDSDTHHSEVIIITGCLRDDLRNDL